MVLPVVTGLLVALLSSVNGFMISLVQPEFIAVHPGGQFTLKCATDDHYEHCDWSRSSDGAKCNFEWKRSADAVVMQDCAGMESRISLTGDYGQHECGIVVTDVEEGDSGIWTCDIEQYVWGDFSSGAKVTATMNVTVVAATTTTTTTTLSPATTAAAVTSAGPTSKLTTPIAREMTTPMTTQKPPSVTSNSSSVVTEQSTTELDVAPEPSSVPEPVPQKVDVEKSSSSTPAVVGILVVLVVVGVLVGGVFYYRKRNAANGAVHYKPDPNDDKVTLNESTSREDSVVSANSNLHEYYPPNLTYSTTTPDSNA